ncbi:translation elongation factor 1-alpha, partial [Aureobasidium melanogenum]
MRKGRERRKWKRLLLAGLDSGCERKNLSHVTREESVKASTHMGLEGTILTMAASPDLMNLGEASTDLPVRRSIFSTSSENLQAMWAVWQSRTGVATLGGVVLGVTGNVTTTDLLDGDVLDVEADVVTGKTLGELLVVHLNGLDLSGDTSGGEGDDHTTLDGTGLDTADGHRANTTDLVDILEGKTEGLVGGAGRRVDGVNGLEESLTSGLGLGLLLPTLVPGAVGGNLDHVVTVETGDGDEGNVLGVVADLLDETGGLLDDLLETGLRPLGGVHLVDGNDELLDTEGVGEKGVLTSLAILGDTSLELTSTGGNDENGAVSLGGTSDHVLDEITVTGGVDDGDHVLGGLELPQGDIDSDTTLTLGLQLVEDPGDGIGGEEVLVEKRMAYLLELLDGTLVDTTALVDQVTGGGRLTGAETYPMLTVVYGRLSEVRLNFLKRAKWSLLEEVKAYQIRLLDEPCYRLTRDNMLNELLAVLFTESSRADMTLIPSV